MENNATAKRMKRSKDMRNEIEGDILKDFADVRESLSTGAKDVYGFDIYIGDTIATCLFNLYNYFVVFKTKNGKIKLKDENGQIYDFVKEIKYQKEWMNEDVLPEMSDEEYDKWYATSCVPNGVRIGTVVNSR